MRSIAVLLGVMLAAGCYHPTVPDGIACGPGDACPRGQRCTGGTCTSSPGGDDDAAVDTPIAIIDAVPDGPPDAPPHASGWFATTQLPSPRSLGCAIAFDQRLYSIGGGANMIPKAEVLVAPILEDGMLGAWTATTPLPAATRWHDCAIHEPSRTIYVVGGDAGTTAITTVYMATIDTTGAVGAWTLQPPLPAGRRGLRVAVVGSTLYALGGEEADGFMLHDTVYVSTIGTTGSLGAWSTATVLPTENYVFGGAVANGSFYLTGGYNESSMSYRAPFGAGTLGPYTATTALPGPRQRHASAATGGYVYMAGGEATFSGANLKTAYRAPIAGDASLGAWEALPDMPATIGYAASATLAGRIYVVGGSTDAGQVSTVYVLYPP